MPRFLVFPKRPFLTSSYFQIQPFECWWRPGGDTHVTLLLKSLHWLHVCLRIDFKVLLRVFKRLLHTRSCASGLMCWWGGTLQLHPGWDCPRVTGWGHPFLWMASKVVLTLFSRCPALSPYICFKSMARALDSVCVWVCARMCKFMCGVCACVLVFHM